MTYWKTLNTYRLFSVIGSTDVINKDKYMNMMNGVVDISEKFTKKRFGYFTLAAMKIDVCNNNLENLV